MLAVEDALDGLRWAEAIGGLPALIERCERSLAAIARWVERSSLGRVPRRRARDPLADLGLPAHPSIRAFAALADEPAAGASSRT